MRRAKEDSNAVDTLSIPATTTTTTTNDTHTHLLRSVVGELEQGLILIVPLARNASVFHTKTVSQVLLCAAGVSLVPPPLDFYVFSKAG